jgi:O-antigen/teichoic acid export membrane protein
VDLVRRRRGWVSKGIWAIMDQGLFAVSSFAVSVLLARWLSPHGYGAFAVAFSLLLLMGTVHTAVLGEPMHVLGPGHYADRSAVYVRRLVPLHFIVTGAMGAVLLVGVMLVALVAPSLPRATLAFLAVSAPGILYLWLMRRACYIDARPRRAALAGLIYALLVPVGLFGLTRLSALTAASGLVLLGVLSLLVGAGLQRVLTGRRTASAAQVPYSDITHAHWNYGKWALGSAVLSWVAANAVVLVLPLWHSLGDAGTLRVATTLMLPVQNVQTALAALIMPALVRARATGQLRTNAVASGLLFVGLSAVYAPVVLVFGSRLTGLVFGPQYRIEGVTLWMLAAIPLVTAVAAISGTTLRAIERPDWVLRTYVAATVVTCLVGLPLVYRFGVDGALAALLLSSVTTAVSGVLASRRLTGEGSTPPRRAGRPREVALDVPRFANSDP